MAHRQRIWAAKKRLELRRLLGMKCRHCGSKDYRKLEFDVILNVTGDGHHKMEWSWRMSYYFKKYRNGNLQLLCCSCHTKKTCKEIYGKEPF